MRPATVILEAIGFPSWSFRVRLAVTASTLMLAACVTLSLVLVQRDLKEIRERMADRGRTIGEYAAREAELSVLSGDTEGLRRLGQRVRAQRDVLYCRFFERDGTLLASVGESVEPGAQIPPGVDLSQPVELGTATWEFRMPVLTSDTRVSREELGFLLPKGAGNQERIGTVTLGMSLVPLHELRRRIFVTTAFFTTVVMLVAVISVVMLAGAISGPLRTLAEATDRIAHGELDATVDVTSRDEIGALARSFNAMVQSLARNRRALEEQSEALRARSRELEGLNVELLDAKTAAETANRAKSVFLANMSHEVRTPLNVIFGYNSLIAEYVTEQGDSLQLDYVERVERAGKRLLTTIGSILDISRIESGTFDLKRVAVPLGPFVERVVDGYREAAAKKGLGMRVDVEEPQAVVRFDEYSLSHALGSIVDNAIKFTEQGEVAVRVHRDETGELRIECRDPGVGIDESYLSELFEIFSQEDSGYTRRYEGAGLALAVTKRLLALNGARVSVESVKGRGSVFTIHFPREVEEAGPTTAAPAEEAPPDAAVGPASPARPRILVVEDEADTQSFMRVMLGAEFEVMVAAGGEEMRRQLSETDRVDMILMDLSLKGPEDGIALTGWLRRQERWHDVPIIAVTAHAREVDRAASLGAGCDDYVAKP
ncbi:MAG: hypothetical protein QOD06_707, partial [Candidatus Binatota bacterium]|nr:hypothetical protein [Candidatus Binatota bacterium]